MTDKYCSPIVRLQDGSIDYQYYSAQGLIAKNKELKLVASKLSAGSTMVARLFPVVLTVVVLALIL